MANPERSERCCLQWDIYNPFLPRRGLEATFYYEYRWDVIFEPGNRGINSREFVITLGHNIRFTNPPQVVVARNVEITVIIFGVGPVINERLDEIQFSMENRYWHHLQETVVMPEIRLAHKLCIKVEFELTRNIGVTNFSYNDNDLFQLSNDMGKVLDDNENKNLKLRSANDHAFDVHYYIIKYRWSNFKEIHRAQEKYDVRTNISNILLRHLITYMYCGDFPPILPFFDVPEYGTELCQVVHRYRLEHLYKVLVKNDLMQHRVAINQMYSDSHVFALRIVENRVVNYSAHTWVVNPDPDNETEVTFTIRLGSQEGNWLSYSLQSGYKSRVFVEVILEVVKKEEGAPETTFPFHGQDQAMELHQAVESGPILFLGCPETFGIPSGANIKYSIRCFLNVSIGTRLELLKSVDTMEYRCPKERYEVLSDHMRNLFNKILTKKRKRKTEKSARMTVSSHPGLHILGKRDWKLVIHKEIFKARVPHEEGWKGIQNITEDPLPDSVVCNVGNSALEYVLEYIYTGKLLNIPTFAYESITDFAKQTDMIHLQKLVEEFISRSRARLIKVEVELD